MASANGVRIAVALCIRACACAREQEELGELMGEAEADGARIGVLGRKRIQVCPRRRMALALDCIILSPLL
eukprot:COSAG05_NODE_2165_length_3447_cov_8.954002_4_plen_71_part_00